MTTSNSDWLDKILYDFADYIKHHERTALGGANHQYATKQAILAATKQQIIDARIDENKSLLSVVKAGTANGNWCNLHDNHVAQCAACRKRKMFYIVCLEWEGVIYERIIALKGQL